MGLLCWGRLCAEVERMSCMLTDVFQGWGFVAVLARSLLNRSWSAFQAVF